MTDRRDLSRRQLLWGLTTIGAAATTGSGTAALLYDSATADAQMTAGQLDLSAEWGNSGVTAHANTDTITSPTADSSGEKRIVLTVDDNPAYICFRTDCPPTSTDTEPNATRERRSDGRPNTVRTSGTVTVDDRTGDPPPGVHSSPSRDRWNEKRDRTNDPSRATSIEERLLVRYGVDRGDGVEWVSTFMTLLEARRTFGEGRCLDGELAPDGTWEFVVQWKTDDVVTNPTDVEFDFEFYASQSRHVDPETIELDWECDTGGGAGEEAPSEISWVAFCSSESFETDGIEPTLSDDGLTVSFSTVPDSVRTVVIKYGRNLDVVPYDGQTSITVGSEAAATSDQDTSGFVETDRSNPVPCPDSFGCKYEFPGWECKSDGGGPESTEQGGDD